MIEKMREKTTGPLFKVIFVLIALSFVLGGIGGGLMLADTSAAKVNGEEISQYAFTSAKNRQQSVLNAEMGEQFWDLLEVPEYAQQFNESVLNQLIDEELLRQYAQQLNLGISADQIKAEIVNTAAFHQDGKFNNALYQQMLRNNGLTADHYAAIVNESMLFNQIQAGIIGSDFSVPAQQQQLAKLLFQKRQVRLASYSLADEIANQTASAEELQAYYDQHQNEFVNPEQLTVQYVSITPDKLSETIQVTPEQIDTYYQTNKAEFTQKVETHFAHIQLADETSANEVAQAVNNGADFATLAKEKSQDSLSAARGGDLGWAKAGTFPKLFEDTAEQLQIGQISSPVQIDGAFHIIKVLDRKADTAIPLEQVAEGIRETIRKELVLTEYSNLTREMANRAFENNASLDSVAEAAGLSVQETAAFTPESLPPELNYDKISRVLFSGDFRQSGQNSEAIEIGDSNQPHTVFLRVSQYQAQSKQTFEQAQATVEHAVKQQKAAQVLNTKATEALNALQAGAANDVQFAPQETLVFAQAELQLPGLAQNIFAMERPNERPTYQIATNIQGDVVIIALENVQDGEESEFTFILPQLEQMAQAELRQNLLNDLRQRAKIEINRDYLEQSSADR